MPEVPEPFYADLLTGRITVLGIWPLITELSRDDIPICSLARDLLGEGLIMGIEMRNRWFQILTLAVLGAIVMHPVDGMPPRTDQN